MITMNKIRVSSQLGKMAIAGSKRKNPRSMLQGARKQ